MGTGGYRFDVAEQNRLVFAIAIVASVISLYALPMYSRDIWSAARGFMIVPGIFAFVYLVMTGAYLKYSNPRFVGELPIPQKMRQFFFDWSIDLFWMGFSLTLIFICAALLGWDGKNMNGAQYWTGFGLAILVLIPIIFLSFRSYHKEQKSQEKPSSKSKN